MCGCVGCAVDKEGRRNRPFPATVAIFNHPLTQPWHARSARSQLLLSRGLPSTAPSHSRAPQYTMVRQRVLPPSVIGFYHCCCSRRARPIPPSPPMGPHRRTVVTRSAAAHRGRKVGDHTSRTNNRTQPLLASTAATRARRAGGGKDGCRTKPTTSWPGGGTNNRTPRGVGKTSHPGRCSHLTWTASASWSTGNRHTRTPKR